MKILNNRKLYTFLTLLGLLAVGTAFVFVLPNLIEEQPKQTINSVINKGEGEVVYRPETSNIVANKTIITEDEDLQVGLSEAEKRSAHKIIKPGAVFFGDYLYDSGFKMTLEITDVNGSEFSGYLHHPEFYGGGKDPIKGHFDWGSNKIWFDQYIEIPEPWNRLDISINFQGEIKSDGISGFWKNADPKYPQNGTFELYARENR